MAILVKSLIFQIWIMRLNAMHLFSVNCFEHRTVALRLQREQIILIYIYLTTKYEFIVCFVQIEHNTKQNNISHDATYSYIPTIATEAFQHQNYKLSTRLDYLV